MMAANNRSINSRQSQMFGVIRKNELPPLPPISNVGIFAPVSSGKTWLLQQFVNMMLNKLVLDIALEFDAELPPAQHIWASPKQMCEAIKQNPFYVVYHPKNAEQAFNWCCDALWQLDQPRWLVVDEVHEIAELEKLDTAVRYARKRLLGLMCVSQRLPDLDPNFRINMRHTYLFYTTGRDIEAIQETWGREISEIVKRLRPCIYDDEKQLLIQTPEALYIARGRDPIIYDLNLTRGKDKGNESAETANEVSPSVTTGDGTTDTETG